MTPDKKRHHFVPKSYLKGFTIEQEKSLIWEYDKKDCQISKIRRSVRTICCRDYYYEQLTPDGRKSQLLEDGLGPIEERAIAVIRQLYERQTALTGKDKCALAFYIALLLTRGPAFRDGCARFYERCGDIALRHAYEAGKLPEPPQELKDDMQDNDITTVVGIEATPQASLHHMASCAEQISESICRKKWFLFYSKKELLAASDTPVMFGPSPTNRGTIPVFLGRPPLRGASLRASRFSSDTINAGRRKRPAGGGCRAA